MKITNFTEKELIEALFNKINFHMIHNSKCSLVYADKSCIEDSNIVYYIEFDKRSKTVFTYFMDVDIDWFYDVHRDIKPFVVSLELLKLVTLQLQMFD